MCMPGSQGIASKIAKAVEANQGLEGVYLNNLKDKPRQLALGASLRTPTLPGIALDVTRARPI